MMDFYEVVAKVIELLQRESRLTYRSIRRQFDLDDEALEDLKEQVLYSQPQVVDDQGKGLIWTGETETKPEPVSTSQPIQTSEQPNVQQDQPIQAEPPIEPPTPDAERRQLTVMFCDLVGSTPLSEQLDPEDLRDVVRAYQQTCAEVVQRFDGHIAQLLGDALLVYFGWPQAHEDDAQRAVRTGLGMLEAMGTLNTRLEQDKGIRLAIRVGIHTGLVVIGEMGGGGHQEQLALGETPNVASRLQGLAEPNTVVMSEATYRLIEGYFTVADLGLHTLKGVAEPQQVYRVLGESGAQSRLEVAATRGLTPLVGRESEVTLLLERWAQAKDGQGQVVLLSGEGGIGKSRLIQVLKEYVTGELHTRWECRSSPYYQNTALYPITDLFQRTLQWQHDETPDEKLEKLEQTLNQYRLPLEEAVSLFAPLLSLPIPEDRYPPLAMSPQRQRQKTLEAIVAILLEQAEQQPVLFILEDLHWTDPTTLEFLDVLIDQIPTTSICTLLTCRPTFQPSWHHRSYLTEVTLNRLSRNQITQMVEKITGGVEKTDGVPLFVEEMTKVVLESGLLKETDGHYDLVGPLTLLTIPSTLQDSLMARLDQLMTAKVIAQLGATIGRQFSYEMLQAVSQLDEATLQRELGRLIAAELVYQRGLPPQAIYLFKHALIVDAAYESLLKSTRQQYHQRIAQTLEERFVETTETQPELLAHHCTEAGLIEPALGYWQKAGENAIQRWANPEAISHLQRGLQLLATLPETPQRAEQELVLLAHLGPVLRATKGPASSEVEPVYTRAYALCQQVGDNTSMYSVYHGIANFYLLQDVQKGHPLYEQCLAIAERAQDTSLLMRAHAAMVVCHFLAGAFSSALTHLDQALTWHDPTSRPVLHALHDTTVVALGYGAHALWTLGYPDQATVRLRQGLARAQELSHPYSMVWSQFMWAWMALSRREVHLTQLHADAAVEGATEHGFRLWQSGGAILQGWCAVQQGQMKTGLVQMRRAIDAWRATGTIVGMPLNLSMLSEAYSKAGQVETGLRVVDEGLALIEPTGARFHEAELHRAKGELLLKAECGARHAALTPEACFHKALEIARHQQAKSLELRAATSLARLWQRQDKRQDAYVLLAPVYGWFTEGFDTADLQEAKGLLDELA
jgi:class 3 adenylate cyclase/predicted ATPase